MRWTTAIKRDEEEVEVHVKQLSYVTPQDCGNCGGKLNLH